MAQRYARWRRGQCFQGDSRNKTGFVVMGFWAIFYFFFETKFCDSKDDTLLLRSYTRTKGATRFSKTSLRVRLWLRVYFDGNLYEMPSHRGTEYSKFRFNSSFTLVSGHRHRGARRAPTFREGGKADRTPKSRHGCVGPSSLHGELSDTAENTHSRCILP